MIIFPHIAKTAGTNLKIDIENELAGNYLLDYDGYEFTENYIIENKFNIIYGHFISDKYNNLKIKKDTLCFLRDPVERTISHFLFWKYILPDIDNNYVKQVKNGEINLIEFCNSPIMSNYYEIILGNNKINDFSFIGITEFFDKSIEIINSRFSTNFITKKENVTNRDKYNDCIKNNYNLLKKINEKNYYYYELAIETFWKKQEIADKINYL